MEDINLRNYAHLGDAVWELFIREMTVSQTHNAKELHKITTEKVNAKFQHDLLLKIQELLTKDELELIRRARNIPVPIARRSNQAEYRMATSFEALIGWWYKNDKPRLEELFKKIKEIL